MLSHRRRGVTQHPPATPCRPEGCVELWASAALAILDDAKASPASVCLASAHNHNSTQRDPSDSNHGLLAWIGESLDC